MSALPVHKIFHEMYLQFFWQIEVVRNFLDVVTVYRFGSNQTGKWNGTKLSVLVSLVMVKQIRENFFI